MNRLNIRWKLTLWNTLALAVLLCVIGLIVFAILRHVVYEQMDRVLQTQFQVLAEDERIDIEPKDRLKHWIEEFHDHVGVYAVIFDNQRQIIASTEQLAPASIPALSSASPAAMRFDSREVLLIGWQRTLQGPLVAQGERYEVLLMLPLEETRRELSQVSTILWSVLPFSLLLAGGIGYLLARKALAPIDQLRRAADQITADRLDQQLVLANPHDELGRLGQTINAMTKRLEASFAEIRRFTADASHELRTPIAVIRTETEVAMKQPLFDAGFYLEATYPLRSDETKGEGSKPGTFGSQKIEYDIIHVCRKRQQSPKAISWPKLRRQVLRDVRDLKDLLEHHQEEGLPEADLQVIRRGKALEYFSRHYGTVYKDQDTPMTVLEALLGINQLLDEEAGGAKEPPPHLAEPFTRMLLRLFDGN